ncbi:DUF2059 domain-containing protein [uncultured Roseobacter sp.]|uniref:DUF2059 domain-containing protein n=1 Tax=uncultured Roseobacter sp. TaxID=114847 RepID=UPI002615DA6A|nr:DUF2059 domain-containing protein [uncultured Roseobacter sp.]
MKFLATVIFILCTVPAMAQDNAQLAAARSFVESSGQQAVLDRMLSVERVLRQTGLSEAGIPDGKEPVIREIIAEELAIIRPGLEKEMTESAAEVFSAEELATLTAFYQSEAGASAVAKMELFETVTLRSFGPTFNEARERMAGRLQKELTD